jgi:hypothetical protein
MVLGLKPPLNIENLLLRIGILDAISLLDPSLTGGHNDLLSIWLTKE